MKSVLGKRSVIFTNGVITNPRFYLSIIKKNDFIICANGGTNAALKLNLFPDTVIGDLDSLSPKDLDMLNEKAVNVQRYPQEKDYSDLELAIMYALENGAAELMILGAGGGRPDQFFANLMLLNLPLKKKIPATLVDEEGEVRLIDRELTVNGQAGELISLFPVSQEVTGISTKGLKYPLCNETLYFSSTRGLSNELEEPRAHITLKKGLLLAIHLPNPIGGGA